MQRWTGILILLGLLVVCLRFAPAFNESSEPLRVSHLPRHELTFATAAIPVFDLDAITIPEPFAIERGQTLSGLLAELGLPTEELRGAVAAVSEHVDVRRIRAGEEGLAFYDADEDLCALELRLAGKGRLALARSNSDSGWQCTWNDSIRTTEVRTAKGELTDVLIASVRRADAPPQLAYRMSDVLQWDLDFNRDLRHGDRFEVLYEEVYLDGESAGSGDILALAYENQGRRLEAYRYGDNNGYYDAEGRPLQKMFLRSPLPFSRVTSRFSMRRFHPVLKVNRPHYGVDYGAPTGTPVRVTAHGTVIFAGRSGGAGKMVKVRHPQGYITAYLHLSGYGAGIRSGKRVRQGDVVGYVGSTGLSTGPHLDYRVQRNGKWIDPLGIKTVSAEPLSDAELSAFLAHRNRLKRALADGDGGDGLLPAPTPRRVATVASISSPASAIRTR